MPIRSACAHVVARANELEGPPLADESCQPLGAAVTGYDPEVDLGEPDLGALRRQADVARQGELTAAAERVAVDRRDHRLGELLDLVEGRLAEIRGVAGFDRPVGVQNADVGTGDERRLSGTGENQGAH